MKKLSPVIGHEAAILESLLGGDSWRDSAGDEIGPYTLVERLGEGGFGVVWRARQTHPVRREVALKVLKPGMDTVRVLTRFERERQVLAGLGHPNIARLHEAAATADGRPCFAMELVDGEPLTEYCRRRGLALEAKLGLFLQVCAAVQHAHQKGVIHRDLKPPNILVAEEGGAPVPKIIDFGISKLMNPGDLDGPELTLLTRQDALLGTPLYMSPEQLDGSQDVDTRCDIYSLGVVLYELLAGEPPFDTPALLSLGTEEMHRALREDRPPRPSTRILRAGAPGSVSKRRALSLPADLDWITMRALEKDRARRYSTAAEFAADIRRFLDREPVLARPPSLAYLAGCWVKKHRALAAAASFSVLALVAGLALALWQAHEARLAQRQAETEAERSRQTAAFLTSLLDEVAAEVSMGRNPEALRGGLAASQRRLAEMGDMDLRIALLDQISRLYDSMSERRLTLEALSGLAELTRARHGADSPEAHAAAVRHLSLMVNHGARGEAAGLLQAMSDRIEARGGRGSLEWFDVKNLLIRAWVKLPNAELAVRTAEEVLAAAGAHEIPATKHFIIMLTCIEAQHAAGKHGAALRQIEAAGEWIKKNGLVKVHELDLKRRKMNARRMMGEYSAAAAVQREIVKEIAGRGRAHVFKEYGRLVEVECQAREHESAIAHAREALALAREPAADGALNRADIADCMRFLADALGAAGRHDEAVQ
ncbi:MAG TPA: serine/threonine-protein kinase, partial [Prosthecobacter sp.]|nr:serine/threonine-protein kinase [Prosthecobacter sp.]